uniref:Ribonuclease A-domain domain-containing protein n=1 Tax=Sander lucioperca TaxID=283035 RepID=A0A8C9ZJB4_SANLU
LQINMKISIFAGVLLISAALISVDGEETPAEKFEREHIITQIMTVGQCTKFINEKHVEVNRACKPEHTFIHTTTSAAVNAICDGTVGQSVAKVSTVPFNIVVCKLKSGQHPNCVYEIEDYNRYIVVPCDVKGDPVLFDRFLSY